MPPTIARSRRRPDDVDWAFDEPGGPVVAFAALCGGAGASTMTYLTASAIAAASTGAVLAVDAGGNSGGLAYYAGVDGPYSLADLVALDLDPAPRNLAGDAYVETASGVRLLAGAPRVAPDARDLDYDRAGEPFTARVAASVTNILQAAQASHAMTVIDCGTLALSTERAALACATHIVWLLPATVSGVERALRALATAEPFRPGQEIVCARRDVSEKKAPMPELTQLADERVAPLLLMPHIPDLSGRDVDAAIAASDVALQAFVTLARR